ncbi:MAG: branched-chain amino acid ABC transporter substrate-binding protein [Gaiellaceae bacterium]
MRSRRATAVAALLALGAAFAIVAAASATVNRSAAPSAASSADSKLISCGNTRTMGVLEPITGPAASLGKLQNDWIQFYVNSHNKTHKKGKLRLAKGDTVLGGPGGTAEAVKAAQSLASNVLGVIGPAGSNEVKAATPTLMNAGFAFVSGSATNTEITSDGTRKGFFFRTVPPDAIQSTSVSNFINKKLKYKRVYIIDDQEAYSTGLADAVQSKLRAAGVTVTRDGVSQQQSDFSALIAKIPRDTQIVYIPWQLPPKGKAFGEQMRSAGKSSINLMGSDGLFDDAFASLSGVYASSFPTSGSHPIVKAFKKAHGGDAEFFGAPSYVAAQVVGGAIDRACKDGKATRAEVRAQVRKTNLKKTLLGFNVKFNSVGDIAGGQFGIWKSNGTAFLPVG